MKERTSFKEMGMMTFLTKEMVELWKNGKLTKSWLNVKMKAPFIIGVSGDYIYFIRVTNGRQVAFTDVPDFYKKCVNPNRKIYEYDAVLEKIEQRDIHARRTV